MRLIILFIFFFLYGTILHAQNPFYSWTQSFGGSNTEVISDVIVDANGNVYSTGSFEGTVDFDPGVGIDNLTSNGATDIFLQKLNPNGSLAWAISLGGTSTDNGYSIGVDGSNEVYITGTFRSTVDFDPGASVNNRTSVGAADIFICKFDNNGNLVWTTAVGGTGNDIVNDMYVNSGGLSFIAGSYTGTADFDPSASTFNITSNGGSDAFCAKFNTLGDVIWARSLGGTSADMANSVTVDNNDFPIIVGSFNGTADFDPGSGTHNETSAGGSDIFVTKLNFTGSLSWVETFGSTGTENAYGVTHNSTNDVIVTGSYRNTVDFDPGNGTYNLTSNGLTDIFVLKLTFWASFSWCKSIGGVDDDHGYDIIADTSNNYYFCGMVKGTVDLDPSAGNNNYTSAGDRDIVTEKIDDSGTYLWGYGYGGTGWDYGQSITLDPLDNIYISGGFQNSFDFDFISSTDIKTSNGMDDCFIQKIGQGIPTTIGNELSNLDIAIFPNPVSDQLIIQSEQELINPTVFIKNQLGQVVFEKNYTSSNQIIIYPKVTPGVYFLQIKLSKELITRKIVVS